MHFPPILLLNTTDETMKEFYDIDESKDDESLKRHNSSDSGVDLHFPETIILPPKKMTKVSLKMKAFRSRNEDSGRQHAGALTKQRRRDIGRRASHRM